MKLINLCPHPICLRHGDGTETVILQSGNARIDVSYRDARSIELDRRAVRVIEGSYGAVIGLPKSAEGCLYVVSHMVRMALPQRCDLLSPADIIRDADGNILACRMFEANPATSDDRGH